MTEEIIIINSDDDENDIQNANSSTVRIETNVNKYFFAKKSVQNNIIGPWQKCVLEKKLKSSEIVDDRTYLVRFCHDNQQKQVAPYELASNQKPELNELKCGTRVIAMRNSNNLPCIIDKSDRRVLLYSNGNREFYAGILIGYHNQYGQFLVFFDDGIVQYVPIKCIRCVLDQDGYKHAHWNAKAYFEFLMQQKKRLELRPKLNDRMNVELNGDWKKVTVRSVDAVLALIEFDHPKRFEWIYLGSPRISKIYRDLVISKAFDKLIAYKTYRTCRTAMDEVTMIDYIDPQDESNSAENKENSKESLVMNRHSSTHNCSPECLTDEKGIDIMKYGALQRPIMTGWSRNKFCHYRTPCGVTKRTYFDIQRYLVKTDSILRIDCFELDRNVRIPTCVETTFKSKDISHGIEKMPIVVSGQQMCMNFEYMTGYNFDFIDCEPENNLNRTGCECEDNCRNKTKCKCWQLTIQYMKRKILQSNEYKDYINIGYKYMRLNKDVESGIVECGSSCKCCVEKCVNRVVQNGLQHELEVFKTDHKGWGVRTKNDLPEGTFICHYAGAILDEFTADQRDLMYQFRLPQTKVNDDDNDSFESDFDSDDEPAAKSSRIESYDVQQPFLNYFPMIKENNDCFPESELFTSSKKMKRFVIDALSHGNVARFVNHSCDPNLFSQKVFVSDDYRFPLIGFFTSRIVKAAEELTIDYAYEQNDDRKTICHCGADNCRKRMI